MLKAVLLLILLGVSFLHDTSGIVVVIFRENEIGQIDSTRDTVNTIWDDLHWFSLDGKKYSKPKYWYEVR